MHQEREITERFEIDPSPPDIDVKRVVKILKEIKDLKE